MKRDERVKETEKHALPRRFWRNVWSVAAWAAVWSGAAVAQEQPVALRVESDAVLLAIGEDASTVAFADKASGINYCAPGPRTAFATVKKGGRFFPAQKAALADGRLLLDFGAAAVTVALTVTGTRRGIAVEVVSVAGEDVEECHFVHVPLALKGAAEEPFAPRAAGGRQGRAGAAAVADRRAVGARGGDQPRLLSVRPHL